MGWIGYEGILKVGYRYSADIVQIQCTYSTDTDSTDSEMLYRCSTDSFIDAFTDTLLDTWAAERSWNTHETAIIEGVVALN